MSYPRCCARLKDGSPCDRATITASAKFCAFHTETLSTVAEETAPKPTRSRSRPHRVLTEATPGTANGTTTVTTADPATVRPRLAAAAAANVEQLQASLLEAAGSATKPVWLTVECGSCGKRSRVEAPVPDVRARVAAIELLLREGLGRPATAEDVPNARMPATVERVRGLSWDQMQQIFAASFVAELAGLERGGGETLLRERIAALSDGERRILRDALAV